MREYAAYVFLVRAVACVTLYDESLSCIAPSFDHPSAYTFMPAHLVSSDLVLVLCPIYLCRMLRERRGTPKPGASICQLFVPSSFVFFTIRAEVRDSQHDIQQRRSHRWIKLAESFQHDDASPVQEHHVPPLGRMSCQ